MSDDNDEIIARMHGVDPDATEFREQILEKLRIQYENSPNPMLPWNVLKWTRDRGLELPAWVVDHFYDKAIVLSKIVADDIGNEAQEVGRALGFGAEGKGAAPAGAELRRHARDWKVAVRIADLMKQGAAKESAVTEAASFHSISTATAYRAHEHYGLKAADFVQSILSNSHE